MKFTTHLDNRTRNQLTECVKNDLSAHNLIDVKPLEFGEEVGVERSKTVWWCIFLSFLANQFAQDRDIITL